MLWAPSSAASAIPQNLFEHRAIVYDAHHLPLAVVHEIYQRQLLPGSIELPPK
jgi:hypothetical protein